jgi:hypothetical protein
MAGGTRAALLALAAAGLLAVTGCGGGGGNGASTEGGITTAAAESPPATTTAAASGAPMPKAQYVQRMQAIGRSLSTSLNTVGATATAAKTATKLASVQQDLRDAADKLKRITPPRPIKAEHAQLERAVRDFAEELSPVITKLRTGKLAAARTVPTLQALQGLREIQQASAAIAGKGYKIGG